MLLQQIGDGAGKGALGLRLLDHLSGLDDMVRRRKARADRPQPKGEIALGIQSHHPLGPAFGGALELAGGQAVQHLIGDQQDGTLAVDGGQAVTPAGCDLRPGQPRILHRVERVARFHEPEIAGLDEGRNHAGGPQDVGHQGAVARPHLDQLKSGWRAQP